ncbi:hypothetical protein GCM10028805_46090 [Spirosoma harenae]
MNVVQRGYLANTGPVFLITNQFLDKTKVIILQASFQNDAFVLKAKGPGYADVLANAGPFPYRPAQCLLGDYYEDQVVDFTVATYKAPVFLGDTGYYDLSQGRWADRYVALSQMGTRPPMNVDQLVGIANQSNTTGGGVTIDSGTSSNQGGNPNTAPTGANNPNAGILNNINKAPSVPTSKPLVITIGLLLCLAILYAQRDL